MYKHRQKKLDNLGERKHITNTHKPTFLHEHSSKIQQKLAYLKEKISEKKKNNEKKGQVSNELVAFMTKIGMGQHLTKLDENGIDSYDILKEVKQAELEQIGIPKGHALKISVNLKKQEEKSRKKSVMDNKSKIQSTLDESGIRKTQPQQRKARSITLPDIIETQTQSIPLQTTKRQFCLYCFSRSEQNFCSMNCEQLYNGMFQRYENNLKKAESEFLPQPTKKEEEQLSDNQEFIQNFDFLFAPQFQALEVDEYNKIKELMKQ